MPPISTSIQWSPRWRKFLYYASLVREVRLSPGNLDPGVLPFLSSLITDRLSILPSLRQLTWNVTFRPSDDLLYALAPTLQQLTVVVRAFPQDRSDIEEAFDLWCVRLRGKLAILSPQISELTVLTSDMYTVGPITSPDYFTRLHTLEVASQIPVLPGEQWAASPDYMALTTVRSSP